MKVIHTIQWDQVCGGAAEKVARNDQLLFAVWTAPISADHCFKEAGFTDFDEPDDDLWDEEFQDILRSVRNLFTSFGEPKFRTPKRCDTTNPVSLLQ